MTYGIYDIWKSLFNGPKSPKTDRNANHHYFRRKGFTDLVRRLWLEPERLDAVLVARTPAKLVAALKSLPRMKGVLGFEHTLDYFILCEKDAGHRLFRVPLTKRAVDWAIVGGNNSQVFLKIWNASSQRGSARDQTWTSLAAQLSRILPRSIELEQGQVVQCPRFTALDCVQTTCKYGWLYKHAYINI